MEGSPKQVALEAIKQADSILVALPAKPDEDALGSALALKLFLEKVGKKVTVLSSEPLPEKLRFLPAVSELVSELVSGKDFIISLKTEQASAEKLSYQVAEGKLNIIITSKEGEFKPEDVSFSTGKPQFDLIITVDTPNLDLLKGATERYPELFKKTTILNIDHHESNDFFAPINLVDPVAAATAEILVSLFEAINRELIDEDIATALFTSLVGDTGSFQNTNTTPKSLTVAAQLLGFGARHDLVIRNLFKSRPLSTLKLWGRGLHRLSLNKDGGLVWSKLAQQDFEETGAQRAEVAGLIDELIKSTKEARVALLLKEYERGRVHGSLRAVDPGVDVLDLAKRLGGGGHRAAAAFELSGELEEVERKVVELITNQLAPSLEGQESSSLQ